MATASTEPHITLHPHDRRVQVKTREPTIRHEPKRKLLFLSIESVTRFLYGKTCRIGRREGSGQGAQKTTH